MLPWNYKKENYGSYWRLDTGVYDFYVFFWDEDQYSCRDAFPMKIDNIVYHNEDEFVEGVVLPVIDWYNSLQLDISFQYLGWEYASETEFGYIEDKEAAIDFEMISKGCSGFIYYKNWNFGGLAAPYDDYFKIKLTLSNTWGKDFLQSSLRHEMTHSLGFAHVNVINGFIGYTPVVKPDGKQDIVHGLDVVYNTNTPFHITGYVLDRDQLPHTEVYLVDWTHNEITYQSPVDSTGYFEFRLRNPLNKYKLFVLSKYDDFYKFNNVRKQEPKKMKGDRYFEGVKLNKTAESLQEIQDKTKIKIIYK